MDDVEGAHTVSLYKQLYQRNVSNIMSEDQALNSYLGSTTCQTVAVRSLLLLVV